MSHAIAERRDLGWQWQSVLGRLELDMNRGAFEAWLEGAKALRIEGETLVVEPRSSFMCDWLNERLVVVVERAVAAIFGHELRVRFVPKGTADSGRCSVAEDASGEEAKVIGGLNASFTLERYLPAAGNRLAFQSCMSLLRPADLGMSPVVVFGSPGMGKTHLLHALAARALSCGWTVACMSAEQFTNRYVDAIRNRGMGGFQAEIRQVRLLILDDLQYLAGKKGTQDELVHTIDEIVNGGGQVVMASELPPGAMDLPERLSSRLQAGVVVRIDPFLMEERKAYVEQLAREHRVALPGWAVERIAGCEVPSVRLLQGAANAAIVLQRAGMLELGQLDARLTYLTVGAASPRQLDDRAVLEAIARHFEVSFAELVGRSRSGSVGEARAVAATILHTRGRSFAQVGAMMDRRDASTVKGICKRGQDILADDPGLRARLAG